MAKKKKLPPGVRERDGRYTYRYSIEVIKDGKRTRKQKETPAYATPKEAYDAGVLIEADKLRGKLVDEKDITLEKWAARWIDDYQIERDPKPYTLRNKGTAINSFKRHFGDRTRMKDITTDDYQKYLNKLKIDGLGQLSIRDYHSTGRMFFRDAARKGIIANDPAANAILPVFRKTLEQVESGEGNLPKFMEKEQLRHFLQTIRFSRRPQDYNIFCTLAYTGLRIGELVALKLSDFNEFDKSLTITKSLTQLKNVETSSLGTPKNNSSIRKVTIGETAIKAIKSQVAWRQKKIEDGEVKLDEEYLFWSYGRPGLPASINWLEIRFDKLLKKAGLPQTLTPHSLRHTHVSLLAEAGVDLAIIQERLGHKNDDITRRVYLHVTEKQKKAAPDHFERIMKSH